MGREIMVDTDRLNSDIARLQETLKALKKQKKQMETDIESLNGTWKGDSHKAFMEQFDSECQNIEEMFSAVEEMIGCMQYAKQQYERCENDINGIISSIKI